jgi:uncharacterized protein with PIN domain
MSIELYSTNEHDEVCRNCAIEAIKNGDDNVVYDVWLSERTDSITKDDSCQKCGKSFWTDGRKHKLTDKTKIVGVDYCGHTWTQRLADIYSQPCC